jgi:HTH-type transcriptional regulator/antitoxin HigA
LIKTESDYAAALERVEKLMDAKPGNAQGDELEVLSLLVHDYEERVFPIDEPGDCSVSTESPTGST